MANIVLSALPSQGFTGAGADRLAFLIKSYNDGVDAYAAKDDFKDIEDERQFCAEAMDQWFSQLEAWTGPAQTQAGAIMALKLAAKETTCFEASPIVLPLINAVLEYLEARALASSREGDR